MMSFFNTINVDEAIAQTDGRTQLCSHTKCVFVYWGLFCAPLGASVAMPLAMTQNNMLC